MLRRVPGQVAPELKAQVAKLLDPKSIALLAIFLSALAVAQAYGVGEIVDAILVGLAWWAARWAGLWAVKDIVTSIIEAGTAQRLPAIDEAAGRFARALLVLGLVFLSKLIERAGDEENVSGPPKSQATVRPSNLLKTYKGSPSAMTYGPPAIDRSPLGGISLDARNTPQILQNAASGKAFENSVLQALGIAKNTETVTVDGVGTSIPDIIDSDGNVTEIKNVANLYFSNQLRIQAQAAEGSFNLIVSPQTMSISAPLQDAVSASGGTIRVFDPTTGIFTPW